MKKGTLLLMLALFTQLFTTSTFCGGSDTQKSEETKKKAETKKKDKDKKKKKTTMPLEQFKKKTAASEQSPTHVSFENQNQQDSALATQDPQQPSAVTQIQQQNTVLPPLQSQAAAPDEAPAPAEEAKENAQPEQGAPPTEEAPAEETKEGAQPEQDQPASKEEQQEPEDAEWSDCSDVDLAPEDDSYPVEQMAKKDLHYWWGAPQEEIDLHDNVFRNPDYIITHKNDISDKSHLKRLYKEAFTEAMNTLILQINNNQEEGMKAENETSSRLLSKNKLLLVKLVEIKKIAKKRGIPTRDMNVLALKAIKKHSDHQRYATEKALSFMQEKGMNDDESATTFGVNNPVGMLAAIKRAKTSAYKGKKSKGNCDLVAEMIHLLVDNIEQGEADIATVQEYLNVIQRKEIYLDPDVIRALDTALATALEENSMETNKVATEGSSLHTSLQELRKAVDTYAERYAYKDDILAKDPDTKFMDDIYGLMPVTKDDAEED